MAESSYKPLDKTALETRFITILPSSDPAAQVACTIRNSVLADCMPFIALSYCWGDPKITTPILLDGAERHVTTNLELALRHLRMSEHGDSLFWADAICINQQDISERNHQVRIMGDIYKTADKVIVWLGDERDGSDEAIQMIELWSEVFWKYVPDKEAAVQHMVEKSRSDKNWNWRLDEIEAFLDRPWWSRRWVLQEVVLAKEVLVKCGRKEFPWSVFISVFIMWAHLANQPATCGTSFDSESQAMEYISLTYRLYPKAFAFGKFEWLMTHGTVGRITPDLFMLAENTMGMEATVPQDRLYSLLGIVSDSTVISVDYRKSPHEVFTEFACQSIMMRQLSKESLGILNHAGSLRRSTADELSQLPSWVPDWKGESPNECPPVRLYHASGSFRSRTHFSTDFRMLGVEGFICDKISDFTPNVDFLASVNPPTIDSLLLKYDNDPPYPTGISQGEAFFRTIQFDCLSVKRERLVPGSEDYNDLLQGFLDSLYSAQGITGQPLYHVLLGCFGLIEGINLLKKRYEPFDPIKIERNITRFSTNSSNGRRSHFITEKGYRGISCEGFRKGDLICVLLGNNTPFVLRKMDVGYRLLSTCFVLGFMDGEILKDGLERNAPLHKFEIY